MTWLGRGDMVAGASSILGPPIRDEVRPVEASRIRFDWPRRVAWALGKMIISPGLVHLDALLDSGASWRSLIAPASSLFQQSELIRSPPTSENKIRRRARIFVCLIAC